MDSHYPTAEQFIQGQRMRRMLLFWSLVVTVVFIFGLMGLMMMVKPDMNGVTAWTVGLAAFICLAIPVAIWQEPRNGVYLLFIGAFLFGGDPSQPRATIPSSMVGFWWNISIIAQAHGSHALDGLPVSPGELIYVMTALSWLVKAVASRRLQFRSGPMTGWILIYSVTLLSALVFGLVRGGNFTIALWQLRAQALLVACYFLAANLLREPRHLVPIPWIMIICSGIQGIFGAITYFTMGAMVDYGGIMPHDDSLLFNFLLFILFLSLMTRISNKLTFWSAVLTPCVVISIMANQRRAGIGAFIVAFLPLVPILWVVWKERRPQIMRFSVAFVIFSAIYLPATWNMSGPFALPARAIRSHSDPNSRDAASNLYRVQEDTNLKYTRDLFPWTGIGFGKPFVRVIVLPEIFFPLRDYFPHNSLLWIWYSMGHFGFFAFLMFVASTLIRGIHNLKETSHPWARLVGILAVLHMIMLTVFGRYDLALTNSRQMALAGMLIGILSVLPVIDKTIEKRDKRDYTEPENAPLVAA